MIACKLDGLQPEFTGHSFPANMNVRRFITIDAVEIDAVRFRDVLIRQARPNFGVKMRLMSTIC